VWAVAIYCRCSGNRLNAWSILKIVVPPTSRRHTRPLNSYDWNYLMLVQARVWVGIKAALPSVWDQMNKRPVSTGKGIVDVTCKLRCSLPCSKMGLGQIIKTSPVGIIIFTYKWKNTEDDICSITKKTPTCVSRNMVALFATCFSPFLRPWRWGSRFLRNVGEFYRTWRYIPKYGTPRCQEDWYMHSEKLRTLPACFLNILSHSMFSSINQHNVLYLGTALKELSCM
jgi:hypothetical protein